MSSATLSAADRVAIMELQVRYANAVDDCDWERFATCWAPHAVVEYRSGSPRGREAITAFVRQTIEGYDMTQHFNGNHTAAVVDGVVRAGSYFQATHVVDGRVYTMFGRYVDEVVETDEGWKLAHRVTQTYWQEGDRSITAEARARGATSTRAERRLAQGR